MVSKRGQPILHRDTGPRSPKAILVAQYSLLVSLGTGAASVTYFTICGPTELVNLLGNVVNIATLVFSATYLIIHQITAWRYFKESGPLNSYRKSKLRLLCLRVCAIVVVAWSATAVLGLLAAVKAPFCEAGATGTQEWRSMVGCKIQRASVAGSILAVFNSCLLFYGIKNSGRPFAASLIGIHSPRQTGEEMQLTSYSSFASLEPIYSEKLLNTLPCNPNLYNVPLASTLPQRDRRSWLLPPLKFQLPDEREHPALQFVHGQMSPERQLTPLLPPKMDQPELCRSHTISTFSDSTYDHSEPSIMAPSSLYSRSTSSSGFSRKTSSASSLSSNSRESSYHIFPPTAKNRTSMKPDVPAIPEKYKHPCHNLRNGGQPVRPGSRPGMPPAGFWMYVTAQQQNYDNVSEGHPQATSPATRPVRSRTDSSGSPLRALPVFSDADDGYIRPLPASPEKAVLRTNVNKANIIGAEKRSYESVRKTSMSGGEVTPSVSPSKVKKRDSRTLVKMRQPWDGEPRSPKRRS